MKFLLAFLLLCTTVASAQTTAFTVYFDDNRFDLSETQRARLDSFIANGMQGVCTAGGFSIEAHTDSRGSDAYNEALASKRLQTVVNVFAKPNVRVCIKSTNIFGERNPIIDDAGDVSRGAANRRVEIIIPYREKALESVRDTPPAQPSPPSRVLQQQILRDTPVSKIKEALTSGETKVGSTLTLDNLEFYGGRHLILPESFPELKQLVAAMKEMPALKIALEGHVCCVDGNGDGYDYDTRTNDLSFQRAKEVNDFLVFSGINASRISYRGFGHRYPKYRFPERNEDERTANRRVEVRIIQK